MSMRSTRCVCLAGVLLVGSSALGDATLDAELIANVAETTFLTHVPGDPTRLFVTERAGRIMVIQNGILLATPFLDITPSVSTLGDGGLLGLAFHPDFEHNGRFFIHYTRPAAPLNSNLVSYTVSPNPNLADPASARIVVRIDRSTVNHVGGWIGFGPNDGFLYFTLGDGVTDGPEHAQDIFRQPLGKVWRLDVDGDDFPADQFRNYAIPPSNPYVGTSGDDEIWALGLRNPYRAGFDRVTGDFYIADVGQSNWEEINFQSAQVTDPLNYGWGCMEGFSCNGTTCSCNNPSLTLPISVYSHTVGCAVIGGTVYRGCAIPQLEGAYIYADYCSGRTWTFRYANGSIGDFRERTDELGLFSSPTAFGEDADGELYVVTQSGLIYKIIAAAPRDRGSCDPVGDIDGDGMVDVADLLILLSMWGHCPGCPADFDGDDAVGVSDLLLLLGGWS